MWYGWAIFGLESLNICHSVIYPADRSEITRISLSMKYRIRINIVDVYHSIYPAWNFCDHLEYIDFTQDSVEVDTSVKWLKTYHFMSERLSKSQGIDKVTCVLCFIHLAHFYLLFLNSFSSISSWQRLRLLQGLLPMLQKCVYCRSYNQDMLLIKLIGCSS